jgi:hypothetical protein
MVVMLLWALYMCMNVNLRLKPRRFRNYRRSWRSQRLTADLMLNMSSVEQQVRKYAEEPVISWSDDCVCKQQVSAVADLLEKLVITDGDIKNSKSEAASRRNTKVDCESQTEANSTQMDRASADDQETVMRLEDKNGKLSVLVEEYKRKTVLLNEEREQMLRDRTSQSPYKNMVLTF